LKLEFDFFVERRLGDPEVKIIIDDYITLFNGNAEEHFEFDIDLPNGGHDLKIVHYGKKPHHHQLDDSGNILIDRHIKIKRVAFDGVDLERELWEGKFFPVYMHHAENEPYFICPNLYLGHNGTWKYEFSTPVLPWLIACRKQGPQLDNTIFQTNSSILEKAKNFFKDLPDV
jgi:hypothetical protein